MARKLNVHDKKYLMVLVGLIFGAVFLVLLLVKMLFTYNYRISERPNSFVSTEQHISCENMGIYYNCKIIYYNTSGEGIDECQIESNHIKRPEVKKAEIYYNTKKDCSLVQKRFITRKEEEKNTEQINYELYEGLIGFGIILLLFLIGQFYYEFKR